MSRVRVHDPGIEAAQGIRRRRFAMAAATYGLVLLASLLIAHIGLGTLDTRQWLLFLGLAAGINLTFFLVFRFDLNLRLREPSLTQLQIITPAIWGLLPLYWLPEARPLILMFYVPPFSFGMLRLDRRQYFATEAAVLTLYGSLLACEYALERPGFRPDYELFLFATFALLLTWLAFFGGFVSDLRRELRRRNDAIQGAHDALSVEVAARARTVSENERLIAELRESLAQVKRLSGLLPICAHCKKVRDDRGYWSQIESYLRSHSEAEFSHGICPDCAAKIYPEFSPATPVRKS